MQRRNTTLLQEPRQRAKPLAANLSGGLHAWLHCIDCKQTSLPRSPLVCSNMQTVYGKPAVMPTQMSLFDWRIAVQLNSRACRLIHDHKEFLVFQQCIPLFFIGKPATCLSFQWTFMPVQPIWKKHLNPFLEHNFCRAAEVLYYFFFPLSCGRDHWLRECDTPKYPVGTFMLFIYSSISCRQALETGYNSFNSIESQNRTTFLHQKRQIYIPVIQLI